MVSVSHTPRWWLPLPFLLIFLTVTAAVISLSILRFETNDDAWMLLLASGQYTGQPESNLVFIGIPIGLFISSLYGHFPGLEWYTMTLIAIQVVSLTTLATLVAKDWKDQTVLRVLYLGLLVVFQSFLLIKLQFTTTAALAATAGLACLLKTSSLRSLPTVIGLLLVFIGINLRFEAGLLAMVVGAPLVFFRDKDEDWSVVKLRIFLIAAGAFVSTLILKGCVWLSLKDQAWLDYSRYNAIRGQIHGRKLDETPQRLPATITESDYKLLRHFLQDPRISTPELHALERELSKTPVDLGPRLFQLRPFLPVYGMVLLVLFWLGLGRPQRQWIPLSLTALTFVGLTAPMAFALEFKLRVFTSALLPCLLLSLSVWLRAPKARYDLNKKQFTALALTVGGIVLGFVGPTVRALTYIPSDRVCFQEKIWPPLEAFLEADERTLLMFPGSIPLEWNDPLKLSATIPAKRIITAGWFTGAPYNIGRYDSFQQAVRTCAFTGSKEHAAILLPLMLDVLKQQGVQVEFERLEKFSRDDLVVLEARTVTPGSSKS